MEEVSCKEKDYLDQDPPIRGQNYVCLSFVSPEDIIQRKDLYFVHEFLGGFSAEMSMMFDGLLNRFRDDTAVVDMITSIRDVHEHLFDVKKLKSHFDHFVTQHRDRLEKTYYEENKFQTSIRGIKVRGSFETLHDAKERCNAIQKFDSKHNVFVAEVGCWCPWSPHAADIQNQEYMETQLNTLVKGYDESRDEANQVFTENVAKNAGQGPSTIELIDA